LSPNLKQRETFFDRGKITLFDFCAKKILLFLCVFLCMFLGGVKDMLKFLSALCFQNDPKKGSLGGRKLDNKNECKGGEKKGGNHLDAEPTFFDRTFVDKSQLGRKRGEIGNGGFARCNPSVWQTDLDLDCGDRNRDQMGGLKCIHR